MDGFLPWGYEEILHLLSNSKEISSQSSSNGNEFSLAPEMDDRVGSRLRKVSLYLALFQSLIIHLPVISNYAYIVK